MKKSCDSGYYNICDAVAVHYQELNDIANEFKYAKLACENATNDKVRGFACVSVGTSYALGDTVVKDEYKALEYFKIACDLAMYCKPYNWLNELMQQYGY